jgi:hypothetical protein
LLNETFCYPIKSLKNTLSQQRFASSAISRAIENILADYQAGSGVLSPEYYHPPQEKTLHQTFIQK